MINQVANKNLIRVNLGCGRNDIRQGWHNLDRIIWPGVETIDFEREALPFLSDNVDYIFSNHVLEHIREPQHILNECWRVLKRKGMFEAKVPYGLWRGASKPVHYQCITACWFDFLRRADIYEWYGYHPWDIVELREIENPEGDKYEVICKMRPRK